MFTLPHISSSQDLNNGELFLHQNHELLSSNYLDANALLEYNQHFAEGFNGEPSRTSKAFPEKKSQTGRKARHSKIYTSQGPRDRRVRLSIAIARKFFDLQEMLGFDKPSKTLDWLLTKSKAAIKDLVMVQKKSQNGVVSSSLSECEVTSAGNIETLENYGSDSKRKSGFSKAKEMRVKARARARARTREKMCMKQMNEAIIRRNNGSYDLMNTSIPIHYMNNNGIEDSILDFRKGGSNDQDLIQESIFIRRKLKQLCPPSIFGFQQNVIFSKDFSTAQSDVCAIFDQHKFINRT